MNNYDHTHRELRAKWKRRMAKGEPVNCWRCGQPINPDEPWDLGHGDDGQHRGPEHANRCNRAAAGRHRPTAKRTRTPRRHPGGDPSKP